ncbi:hypothetical protein ACOMHN_017458 [Nucella lapillus]
MPSCGLRTTIATVSSRRLTGSEADKLGRPPGGLPKTGLLPAGLSFLWDGQHHFPVQGQDDVFPLRTATMQRQILATLQEFSLGRCGSSLTSDVCRLEGSSCQLAAVATPVILSNEISLTFRRDIRLQDGANFISGPSDSSTVKEQGISSDPMEVELVSSSEVPQVPTPRSSILKSSISLPRLQSPISQPTEKESLKASGQGISGKEKVRKPEAKVTSLKRRNRRLWGTVLQKGRIWI